MHLQSRGGDIVISAMIRPLDPFRFVLIAVSGWLNGLCVAKTRSCFLPGPTPDSIAPGSLKCSQSWPTHHLAVHNYSGILPESRPKSTDACATPSWSLKLDSKTKTFQDQEP
jgi:hypothetical protein